MISPKLPRNTTTREASPICQFLVNAQMPSATGIDNNKAVNADNSLGERFLVWIIPDLQIYLKIKLVSHALYGGDTVNTQFLSYFPDMNINGTVTNDHFISPDLVQDLVSKENSSRSGCQ